VRTVHEGSGIGNIYYIFALTTLNSLRNIPLIWWVLYTTTIWHLLAIVVTTIIVHSGIHISSHVCRIHLSSHASRIHLSSHASRIHLSSHASRIHLSSHVSIIHKSSHELWLLSTHIINFIALSISFIHTH